MVRAEADAAFFVALFVIPAERLEPGRRTSPRRTASAERAGAPLDPLHRRALALVGDDNDRVARRLERLAIGHVDHAILLSPSCGSQILQRSGV
jgi:hypothetical protein